MAAGRLKFTFWMFPSSAACLGEAADLFATTSWCWHLTDGGNSTNESKLWIKTKISYCRKGKQWMSNRRESNVKTKVLLVQINGQQKQVTVQDSLRTLMAADRQHCSEQWQNTVFALNQLIVQLPAPHKVSVHNQRWASPSHAPSMLQILYWELCLLDNLWAGHCKYVQHSRNPPLC